MTFTRSIHGIRPLKRAVHAVLLLVWLLSCQGIAPALCLAVATIDGQHTIKVGATKDGALTMVLSHTAPTELYSEAHQHGALCNMLMFFAESPRALDPDHVLAFKSVDGASRADRNQASSHDAAPLQPHALCVALIHMPAPIHVRVSRHAHASAWHPGLATKTGRMIMLC